MHPSRRTFIKQTLAATAALSLPARIYAAAEGANSDIRIAGIGFRGRGMDNLKGLLNVPGVRLTALCDCDQSVLDKGKAFYEGKGQKDLQTYKDLRKLMEDKNVDVVMIATPNHWHSLAGIWAAQAGKDVYVEKPVSHNVLEGRKLVEAARKYNKIIQTGTQSRSSAGLHQAAKWASEGNLGKLLWARGTCYKRRASIGKVSGPTDIPSGIDYDLWCGPAPKKPLMREKLHYDWHWVWDTGNGDLGNQGIHQMDIARWFMGEKALSPAVYSVGGRLGYIDDGETPNTQLVVHNYEKAPLYFEVQGLPASASVNTMDSYRGSGVGVVVQYENGYIVIPSYTGAAAFDNSNKMVTRWGSFAAPKDQPDPGKQEGGPKMSDHYTNFIDAVRSRKNTDLTAEIEEGHISSALCHTGNISYVMGKKAGPDVIREKVKADKEALDSINRMIEHLGKNNVDVKVDQLAFGEMLKMDPKTEKFIGNAAADKLLTREYRAPFVVPEKV
jgi:predicted dehydrogenase